MILLTNLYFSITDMLMTLYYLYRSLNLTVYLLNLTHFITDSNSPWRWDVEGGGQVELSKLSNKTIFPFLIGSRNLPFQSRFLNSHHPFTQKRGTMYSLIDRILRLSHPKFHKNNFDHIIKILLDNGYPLDLIFTTIRRRLHIFI